MNKKVVLMVLTYSVFKISLCQAVDVKVTTASELWSEYNERIRKAIKRAANAEAK